MSSTPESNKNFFTDGPSTSSSEPPRKRRKIENDVGSALDVLNFFSSFPVSTKDFEPEGKSHQSNLKTILNLATPSLFQDYNSENINQLFESLNLSNFLDDDVQAIQVDIEDDITFIKEVCIQSKKCNRTSTDGKEEDEEEDLDDDVADYSDDDILILDDSDDDILILDDSDDDILILDVFPRSSTGQHSDVVNAQSVLMKK